MNVCISGVRNVSFAENFANAINEWSLGKEILNLEVGKI